MAKQVINIGAKPSDGSGDPLRISFDKINSNFSELYTAVNSLSGNISGNTVVSGTVTSVAGKTGNVSLTVSDVSGAVSKGYVDTKLGEVVAITVDSQINALIDGAPDVLNTLRELAEAMQNDPNFHLSIAAQLGDKLSKSAGGTMQAPIYLKDATPTQPLEATSKQYVDNKINNAVSIINTNLNIKQIILDGLVSQISHLPISSMQSNIALLDSTKANITDVYTKAEIDAIILNITASSNENDWGSVIQSDDDFGSVTVAATEFDDYGSIING